MSFPTEPVTLSPDQVRELGQKIADLRHEVNNSLSWIAAAAEILRRHPERGPTLWEGLIKKPHRVADDVSRFSRDLEKMLRIEPD
jgi:hypothetical protein